LAAISPNGLSTKSAFFGLIRKVREACEACGPMRTRVITLTCGILTCIAFGVPSASRAQTNSWIQSSDGAWQNPANWFLFQAPTNTQSLVITNDISKTITIDATTSGSFSNTLTVTDVILSTPSTATNILDLSNAGTNTPLTVLNNFLVSSGGLLRVTGSALWMEANTNAALTNAVLAILSNGVLSVDGALLINSNGVMTADTGICVGEGTNANGLALLGGGQLILTNAIPSAIGVNGTGQMILSNGQLQTATSFLFVGSGKGSQGNLNITGGTWNSSTNARLVVGMETGAVGQVTVNGGNLIATNSLITLIGCDGSGELDLLNGTNVFGSMEVGGDPGSQGTLNVAGGVNTLQAGLSIADSVGATGAVWLTGGQLVDTNFTTTVANWGNGTVTISNGSWVGTTMLAGQYATRALLTNGATLTPISSSEGTINVAGGAMTLYSKLVLGNCSTGGVGVLNVTGGSLYVTNAAHNAFIDVRSGEVNLSGGLLQADILIMTNACGLFVRGGGTLVAGSVILDPNLDADGDGIPNGWEQAYGLDPLNAADASADPDGDGFSNLQEYLAGTDPTNAASRFQITSIISQGNDVKITWSAVTNKSYVVQMASGFTGSVTNGFSDLGTITIPSSPAIATTNYVDLGGATNGPARFYRVKLVTSP
jgi:thrombospondin type 3 repeat protein